MDIAVAGSSGLGPVIGVGAQPAALLTALPTRRPEHVLVLAPRHLERRAREQAHVVVAAHGDVRVGVLALDHHALALTLIAAAALELRGAATGWTDPGAGVRLVRQSAARTRSVVWHPRILGLRLPVPSLAQSAASLVRRIGYFSELGSHARLTRGPSGFVPDAEEVLFVSGEPPRLLLDQLGDAALRTVSVASEPTAPYRTRDTVELCGLVWPAWPLVEHGHCDVCGASRPAAGCLFCGTGAELEEGSRSDVTSGDRVAATPAGR